MDDLKRCSRCHIWQDRSLFSRHRRKKDGLSLWCKACDQERIRTYNASHAEEKRAKARAYYRAHVEQVQAANKTWREQHIDQHRAYKREYMRAYSQQHPERHRATQAVAYALKTGKITRRETCELCGGTPTEAHHYLGYTNEHYLDVQWLCRLCHRRLSLPPQLTETTDTP